jgi:outer membrane protein OmpA-like peptidoglycan-associated protein
MTITKKTKIIAAVLAGALALYALAGFYLLPMLARSKLPALLAEKTGQQAQLQAVRFNPFKFVLELEGFALSAPDMKVLLAFDAFAVDVNAWASLTGQAVVLDSVVLRKPVANIERHADGGFNFSEILPKDAEAPPEDKKDSGPLPLTIRRLAIEDGQAVWQDSVAGQPQTETLLPVNLAITELTTQSGSRATFDLGLGLASGGHLQWQGDLDVAQFASKGRLSVEQLVLPKVWRLFLQDLLPVEIAEGQLSLQTEYEAALGDSGLALSIHEGAIDIKQLEIAENGKADELLVIPSVAVRGIAVDLNKRQINISALTSGDAQIKAWLQADGKVNYQALFAKQDDTAAVVEPSPAPTAPPSPSWQISLDELSLNNYQIQFTDYTQPKPVELQLSGLGFKLQKFSNRPGEKLPLQLTTQLNKSGQLDVGGDIVLQPFSADLKLDIKDVDLKRFQSYLDSYLNLELVNGDFSGRGNLKLALADELQLDFHGDANLANLITRDKAKNKDFLKWSDLQVQQIDVDLAKQDYKLGKVVFERPYVRFTINKDKTTNINAIVVPQLANPAVAEKPAERKAEKPKTKPVISIGKIELKDGKSNFADYSLILPFVAEMNALNGEVDGFSSEKDSTAKLALKGKVYDLALVGIKGNYQLQTGDSDIVLNFTHLPLPLITPYMAEFAGYRIEKGQMALDLQYKIKKGQLEAKNKVFIDQLTLGEHVENPNAVSLPLHLAVALLKDANGKINLDFPVTGSLEDPQFSVGSLISDVLINLVKKVAMSPFQALGSLLDDKQDFSAVSFAAGEAVLTAEESAKLDQLGKALQSKPELVVEVKGMAYQAQDWPVMRFDALKDILKKMKSGELRDKGEKIRSEYIELSDDEYKRLLAKFFKEVFPQEIDYSLLGKPRIKAQPDADFYALARQKLEAIMPPEPQRLNDLAVARANAISKYLMEKAGVDRGRVYVLAPELDPANTVGIVSVLSLNVAP